LESHTSRRGCCASCTCSEMGTKLTHRATCQRLMRALCVADVQRSTCCPLDVQPLLCCTNEASCPCSSSDFTRLLRTMDAQRRPCYEHPMKFRLRLLGDVTCQACWPLCPPSTALHTFSPPPPFALPSPHFFFIFFTLLLVGAFPLLLRVSSSPSLPSMQYSLFLFHFLSS
jgi:hypothetical protein